MTGSVDASPWAATDDPVYASTADGTMPQRLSFADVDRLAKGEKMVPGYAIIPPSDVTEDGETVYGSYTVVNAWPQKLSEQRTLYLNQFTGRTITNATAAQDGALSRLTSFGIAMHMGNQLGWVTRISATIACLGVLISVSTGLLMWWKRRPTGRTGLPARVGVVSPANASRRLVIVVTAGAVALGILFPVFGVSLLLVFAVEAVLARRARPHGAGSEPSPAAGDAIADDAVDEVPTGALQEAKTATQERSHV